MYKFNISDDIKEFDNYVLNNNGSFFQTSMGAKMKKFWQPVYLVGKDNNNQIVFAALLLKRRIIKFVTMGYFHSGFVCNYDNETLLNEAFDYIKHYCKRYKISFVFFDPEIIKNINGETQSGYQKYHDLFIKNNLCLTTKNEPFIQPRFTYIIDLFNKDNKSKTLDEVMSSFEKGVRSSIKSAPTKGLKYEKYTYDQIKHNPKIIDEFMGIMEDTMERLETSTRTREYYLNVLEVLQDYVTLDMIYYDYNEDYRLYNENINALEELKKSGQTQKSKEMTDKIESFNKRMVELDKAGIKDRNNLKLYVAGGVTVFYANKTTCLYGGTKNILRNATRSSHYLNFKRIENSVTYQMHYHDFLRAHVLYHDERDKNYGLSLFKKSFGADEIEYIGEYAIVVNKFYYFLFKNFYKRLKKVIMFVKRRRR